MAQKFQPDWLRDFVKAGVSTNFWKMEKEIYLTVIRFLFLEGKSRNEINKRRHSSPCFNEFQHYRSSVFDGYPENGCHRGRIT